MKKIFLLLLIISTVYIVNAQDEAIFTHYNITPILINPAAAGIFEEHQFQLTARAQWTGFDDAPVTLGAHYNGPLGNTVGLGIGIRRETAAQLSRINGQFNFAFRFPINDNFKLSAGFLAEVQQIQLDNGIISSDDNLYSQADDVAIQYMDGQTDFDAGVGFWGVLNDRTYFGLTLANLVRARIDDIVTNNNTNQSPFQYYLFTVGHKFDVSGSNFTLEPSVLFRQVRNAPFQMDVNVKAGFLDDQFVAGLSYRNLEQVGVMLGTSLNKFRFYYTYDVSFQQFQSFNGGTHEVTVLFALKKKDKIASYGQPQN